MQLGNIQFLHCPALIPHSPIDTIRLVTLIHAVSACKRVFLFQSCPCSMLLWRYQLPWSVKWQVIRPPVERVSNARLEKSERISGERRKNEMQMNPHANERMWDTGGFDKQLHFEFQRLDWQDFVHREEQEPFYTLNLASRCWKRLPRARWSRSLSS